MRRALLTLFAVILLAFGLAACGGSDDSSTGSTASSTAPGQTSTGASTAADEKGGGETFKADSKDSTSASQGGKGSSTATAEKPASLATDPNSISGAIVTAKGAVQTLPPSTAAQAEAMKNSYSSIKAFGEESEGSEATDITYALAQYLTAKANGDSATACARLYSVLRDNVAKTSNSGSCPEAYGALMKNASKSENAEAARIDVASVRRGESNRAFVIYKTPNTLSADMPMYLEDGVWTVGAIEAFVLTPEQLQENQG